jgi:hypothetical protein
LPKEEENFTSSRGGDKRSSTSSSGITTFLSIPFTGEKLTFWQHAKAGKFHLFFHPTLCNAMHWRGCGDVIFWSFGRQGAGAVSGDPGIGGASALAAFRSCFGGRLRIAGDSRSQKWCESFFRQKLCISAPAPTQWRCLQMS